MGFNNNKMLSYRRETALQGALSQLIVQISLQRGHFDSKFQVQRIAPNNHSWTVS